MLKVSGMYVSPAEVEAALIAHQDVLEAAVVGAADEDGLIKPKAFVVGKPGSARMTNSPGHSNVTPRPCWRRSNARARSPSSTSCRRLRRQDPALQIARGERR